MFLQPQGADCLLISVNTLVRPDLSGYKYLEGLGGIRGWTNSSLGTCFEVKWDHQNHVPTTNVTSHSEHEDAEQTCDQR
jgi:hypothetical protein